MEEINVLLVLSISKVDIVIVPLLYLISYLLVGKIEICLKYFLDKNAKKQTLCPCLLDSYITTWGINGSCWL